MFWLYDRARATTTVVTQSRNFICFCGEKCKTFLVRVYVRVFEPISIFFPNKKFSVLLPATLVLSYVLFACHTFIDKFYNDTSWVMKSSISWETKRELYQWKAEANEKNFDNWNMRFSWKFLAFEGIFWKKVIVLNVFLQKIHHNEVL